MFRLKYDIKELCTVPPPYGGVTVHVKRLIDRLTKDGYLVGAYYGIECTDDKIKQSDMYDLLSWDINASKVVKVFRHLHRFFNRIKEVAPYKIVHSHSGFENMFLIWILKNFCKKKVVVTIHNAMQVEFYAKTNVLNKYFMKRLVKQDMTWIAVSEQTKSEVLKLPLKFKNEIIVIPAYIPVDIDVSEPLSDEMQSYIDTHNHNIVFYAHSFMCNRGVDVYGFDAILSLYANICKSLKNVGLILCLAESQEKEKINALHVKATNYGINDKMYWQIGGIDNMQVLWSQTDVYVRPTNTDGDSLAVREALDFGAVVVASDVCQRPDRVLLYQYGNNDDLLSKVKIALNMNRREYCPDYRYYYMIKDIYDGILKRNVLQ